MIKCRLFEIFFTPRIFNNIINIATCSSRSLYREYCFQVLFPILEKRVFVSETFIHDDK